jgi:ABC-2 type transport system ATP-binding protein
VAAGCGRRGSRSRTHGARRDLYEALGFGRYAATRVGRLPGGTYAKPNLALALLPDAQVPLLDEPYVGFDFDTYVKFWDLDLSE